MTTIGLTSYVTPQMLLSSNFGISWKTFPQPGAAEPENTAALLDICATITAEMDTLANHTLRATLDTEQEFGPDFSITMLPNGWTRFRLSNWPILQLVSGQVSPAGTNPASFTAIPATALLTEHAGLPLTGTIVPSAAGPGPTAALIAPGYVSWNLGRKGYLVQIQDINGFPVAGMDQAALVGATSIHVDDITGWWNGTAGARGTIFDPPYREQVVVSGTTPDVAGSLTGPGSLTLVTPLQFPHNPTVGSTVTPDQRILVSAMPSALIQAGYYLGTHYGLMRGGTAAVMQAGRGGAAPSQMKAINDWYQMAESQIARYARVF